MLNFVLRDLLMKKVLRENLYICTAFNLYQNLLTHIICFSWIWNPKPAVVYERFLNTEYGQIWYVKEENKFTQK